MRRIIQQEGTVYINIREMGAELLAMRSRFMEAKPEGLKVYKTIGQLDAIVAMQQYLNDCMDVAKK